jgi:mRNA-degrading endonuclease HigB of HigAB toxin-antitoxin module
MQGSPRSPACGFMPSKAGRVVFNIKGNDYRLIARLQYPVSVLRGREWAKAAVSE